MYWDLVYAYENVTCRQEALTSAESPDCTKQQAPRGPPPIQVGERAKQVSTDNRTDPGAEQSGTGEVAVKNALSRSIEDPVLAEADMILPPPCRFQRKKRCSRKPINGSGSPCRTRRSRIDLNSRDLNSKQSVNALLPRSMRLLTMADLGWRKHQSARPSCVANPTAQFCYKQNENPPPFQGTGNQVAMAAP